MIFDFDIDLFADRQDFEIVSFLVTSSDFDFGCVSIRKLADILEKKSVDKKK